jgi:hypothetical protein
LEATGEFLPPRRFGSDKPSRSAALGRHARIASAKISIGKVGFPEVVRSKLMFQAAKKIASRPFDGTVFLIVGWTSEKDDPESSQEDE